MRAAQTTTRAAMPCAATAPAARVARLPCRRCRRQREPARGRAADRSRRHPRHPLHLGHHRPGQGRALPARAAPLVGRAQRRGPRRRRRRRALHDAAALPHQRAQHLRAGVARRLPRRLRAALLGVGVLADDARARGDRRLPARRDGADPARAAGVGGRARPSRAHRPRSRRAGERRRGVSRAHRRAAARRLRLDRDELRHRQRAGPVAPRLHGVAAAGLRGPRRRRERRRAAGGRSGRAAAARRRAVRVLASGYFGKPEATVAAWRNRWFHTGDRVVRDADGCFRFVDRLKDAIRRRGENISSYEVEQVLQGHPAVAAVAVYPVRSELGRGRGDGGDRRPRRRGARSGRAGRLLRDAPAVLRDPALRRRRRRPAAHRERQGAEVQAARARRDGERVGPAGRDRRAEG